MGTEKFDVELCTSESTPNRSRLNPLDCRFIRSHRQQPIQRAITVFKGPRTLDVGNRWGRLFSCESFSYQDATSMRDESDSATMAALLPAAFERPLGISDPSGPQPACELSRNS